MAKKLTYDQCHNEIIRFYKQAHIAHGRFGDQYLLGYLSSMVSTLLSKMPPEEQEIHLDMIKECSIWNSPTA